MWFGFFCLENTTPILVDELRGDLAKAGRRGRSPEEEVAILATKFGGSGGTVSASYRYLLRGNLEGNAVPMTGQIIPDNWTEFTGPDGDRAVLIDLSSSNRLIIRLADKQVSDVDRKLAKAWRARTETMSSRRLGQHIRDARVAIGHDRLRENLSAEVDRVLDAPENQRLWGEWLASELGASALGRREIGTTLSSTTLREAFPYAHFCMRAELLLLGAERVHLVKAKPSNQLDLQYLFYVPFCQVFVSDDRLHRTLAPLLIRDDQSFVECAAFKRGLAEQGEYRESLEAAARTRLDGLLGSRPVPLKDNVIHALWERHMVPWTAESGCNRAIKLTADEWAKGVREVEALYRATRDEA